jgi:hypothetical protein
MSEVPWYGKILLWAWIAGVMWYGLLHFLFWAAVIVGVYGIAFGVAWAVITLREWWTRR